ncbi:MAG: hypothetical protein II951_02290 [Bacteroidales bacterium]|nr:hypothetical protein [Bacteroidales bacterium]
MAHVSQIKRAFGIDGVMTKAYAWRSKDTEQRSQIDLISAGSGSGDWSNAGLTTEREKEGFYASHRGQGDTESTEGERTLAGEGTEGSPNGEGEKEGEKEKTQSSWR